MNDYNSHILPITRENGFKQPRNLVCLTNGRGALLDTTWPAFSDHSDVVDNSVQQVCFLTLLSHPDNIWLDSLLAIDARMLVLRATRTWAGAYLEASSRGNAHNTLTNSAATNTLSFPGVPAWFHFLLQFAPHPHYLLCWRESGEGVGDFPVGYFVSCHLDF